MNDPISFQPTRSFVYRATRNDILPKIAELARPYGDQSFLLRDLTKKVLNETYIQDQLEIRIKKERSDEMNSVRSIFGFYVPFLAEKLEFFENTGGGLFKNISLADEVAEAEAVATDVDDNESGIIYAYSFPSIRKGGRFPIKVGLTTTGDAAARVIFQCKQTCCFEQPVILGQWEVQRVAAVEKAIHSTLDARGFTREEAPGREWFNTSVEEIEKIIRFVQDGEILSRD